MQIYCIGDSHVSLFSGINKIQPAWPKTAQNVLPFFKVCPVGPALAYNLVQKNTRTRGREKIFAILKKIVPKHANVILSFGEIDCRAHILKFSRIQKTSSSNAVSECVNRYFSVILDIRKLGYFPLIYNAIPSTLLSDIKSKNYPTLGSCIERNRITKQFNNRLKALCLKNKIGFISTYKFFVNNKNITDMNFYMDSVHLSQKAMPITIKTVSDLLELDLSLKFFHLLKYKAYNIYQDFFNVAQKYWRLSLDSLSF